VAKFVKLKLQHLDMLHEMGCASNSYSQCWTDALKDIGVKENHEDRDSTSCLAFCYFSMVSVY